MSEPEVSPFSLEVGTLDADVLIEQLRGAEQLRRHLEAVQAATVAELDRRKVYRRDGHASVLGLVRVVTQRPTGEARALVQTGELMRHHPEVAAALGAGCVGVAQTHDLARARAHPRAGGVIGEVIPLLLDEAQRLPYPDFQTLVQRAVSLADADGADQRAAACHERRDAFFHLGQEGVQGQVRGGVLAGEAMVAILDQFRQAEFEKDWAWTQEQHGDAACPALMPRTDAQRRFDALEAIFATAVSTPAGSQPPSPVVNLHCDVATFGRTLARALGLESLPDPDEPSLLQRRCETANGIPIAPVEVLAAILAGHIRRVVCDSASVTIDLGRTQRLFTGSARIAAHMLIPRCIWPGCEVPARRCQTDHLTDWRHLGTTSPKDGAPCCPRHNLEKNRGYSVQRATDGTFRIFRPDGSEIR